LLEVIAEAHLAAAIARQIAATATPDEADRLSIIDIEYHTDDSPYLSGLSTVLEHAYRDKSVVMISVCNPTDAVLATDPRFVEATSLPNTTFVKLPTENAHTIINAARAIWQQ